MNRPQPVAGPFDIWDMHSQPASELLYLISHHCDLHHQLSLSLALSMFVCLIVSLSCSVILATEQLSN